MNNWRQDVLNIAGRIAKWAPFSSNNGFGRGFVQGPEEDASLGEKAQPQPVRILQHFGFRSTPPKQGSESVVIAARGGPANAIAAVIDNQQLGPTDLKEGEACVFNSKDTGSIKCRIKLDENADVTVNDGTAQVARVGDACRIVAPPGSLAAWMAQVEAAINSIAPGTVTPLSVTFLEDPGIQISTGADRFKA